MAHAGRKYKLQFRRDLASEPNNNLCYPEAATFTMTGLGGIVGVFLNGLPIRVYNLLTNAQPPMVWSSDVEIVNGHTIRYIVTLRDMFQRADVTTEFRIINAVGGATLFHQPPSIAGLVGSRSNWFMFGAAPDIETPLVLAPLGPPDGRFDALLWNQYP